MLKALVRWLWPQEAAPTRKGHSTSYLTSEELEERLGEFSKQHEWLLNEWYEKFSTLHARLAKRAQRDAPPPPEQMSAADLLARARAKYGSFTRAG